MSFVKIMAVLAISYFLSMSLCLEWGAMVSLDYPMLIAQKVHSRCTFVVIKVM